MPESPQFQDTFRKSLTHQREIDSPIEFKDQGYDFASENEDRLSCKMSEDSFGSDVELKNTFAAHLQRTEKLILVGDESPMQDYLDASRQLATPLPRNETPLSLKRISQQESRVMTAMSNKIRPNKGSNLNVQQAAMK